MLNWGLTPLMNNLTIQGLPWAVGTVDPWKFNPGSSFKEKNL